MRARSFVSVFLTPVVAVGMLQCAKTPDATAPELLRVQNADLGVAIAALPEAFSVVTASGPTIELSASGEAGAGTAVIAAGPEEAFGINLVDAVKERKALFEGAVGSERVRCDSPLSPSRHR